MVRLSETMNKIKMQLICVSETLSEDETDLSFEDLKSSQLPMSLIARTLLTFRSSGHRKRQQLLATSVGSRYVYGRIFDI